MNRDDCRDWKEVVDSIAKMPLWPGDKIILIMYRGEFRAEAQLLYKAATAIKQQGETLPVLNSLAISIDKVAFSENSPGVNYEVRVEGTLVKWDNTDTTQPL